MPCNVDSLQGILNAILYRLFYGRFDIELSEANDAARPIALERRVGYPFARRGVIETILVSNDSHMAEAVQEYERTKFIFFIAFDRS